MNRPLEQLVAELAAVPDVGTALRVATTDFGADGKITMELLAFDGRRNVIYNREQAAGGTGIGVTTGQAQVAMDHLPAAVRQGILSGEIFVAVGEESDQYAKLWNLKCGDGCRLFLKGLLIDNTLAAILAVCDCRRRMSGRLLDRVESVGVLFSLAYARLYEREARFEAVSALHDVTARLRTEHLAAQAELEQEILRLRTARGDVIDLKRVEQLQASAENAKRRALTAERRLEAVEHQVTSAVERLQQAHVQLHEQNEMVRQQAETIQKLEALLPEPARRA